MERFHTLLCQTRSPHCVDLCVLGEVQSFILQPLCLSIPPPSSRPGPAMSSDNVYLPLIPYDNHHPYLQQSFFFCFGVFYLMIIHDIILCTPLHWHPVIHVYQRQYLTSRTQTTPLVRVIRLTSVHARIRKANQDGSVQASLGWRVTWRLERGRD